MKKLLIKIYNQAPIFRHIKKIIGIPTPLITENIIWDQNHKIKFKFIAPFPVAQKAKEKGIESTMLRSALSLLGYREGIAFDKVVLDVGANWGFLSLVFAKTVCHPDGKVLAFEPHPKVLKALTHTTKINHLENIINLYEVAVGAESKNARINLFNGTSNMLKPSKNSISVRQITLDSLVGNLASIDLVKVDVDGYEYNVLLGSEDVIKKFKPVWIVETNNDERIIPFFIQRGYSVFDLHMNPASDKTPDNIICVPERTPSI
ncbi:MAG: FkbM family methyltransferase [Saprospiraceae bacterium]|nr:FkbM family methyltransferase [Saprospiraceae bacterium]